MKKLYIAFILLFGFLTFVPQIALGDRISYIPPEEIQRRKEQYKRDLICVNEKKEKLPKEYTGPNIKPVTFTDYPYVSRRYEEGNLYQVDTYLYKLNYFDQSPHFAGNNREPNFGITTEGGIVYNCKEYIELYKAPRSLDAYDVTDVPPGSYLKYIPEAREFQVLPPTEESYKEIIESQKKQLEKRNERIKAEQKRQKEQDKLKRWYKIKTTILNIIFVIGVLTLLVILTKEIRKKL